MTALRETEISAAISRQRQGWTLEQAFYTSADIYEFERAHYLAQRWYVLGHASEMREAGSYIVRELLGESLIVVRDSAGVVRGFYNVCRHRGSRICDKDGRAQSLVCPYHAWSYRLDGSVRQAPALPAGIDLSELGLKPVAVREIGGVILGSLKGDPQSLDAVVRDAEPLLRYQGIPQARIAARRRYFTRANWKLVMENWYECYHCYANHPEFCKVMQQHVQVLGREATPEVEAAWMQEQERWAREEADPNTPVKLARRKYNTPMQMGEVSRTLVGGGLKTQSQGGEPVAPLMGQLRRYDGGVSSFGVRPFSSVKMLNDYAVIFQFYPSGPQETDIYFTWLVDGAASDADVDVERLIWMWDVTVRQDVTLAERNAAGVRSSAYSPGPYAKLESRSSDFITRYLQELSAGS
jgi:Rieske 2Fe-2S family protein